MKTIVLYLMASVIISIVICLSLNNIKPVEYYYGDCVKITEGFYKGMHGFIYTPGKNMVGERIVTVYELGRQVHIHPNKFHKIACSEKE